MVSLVTSTTVKYPYTPLSVVESGYWQWTKVWKKEDNIFEIIQYPVGCKDYIVDTYYRTPPSMPQGVWTSEQLMQPYVALYFPNVAVATLFKANVIKLLKPWEDKNNLKNLIVHPVETSWNTKVRLDLQYVIEFDEKIMRTATALSFYLSLIRTLGFNKTNTLCFNFHTSLCNEYSYYEYASYQPLLNSVIESPKFLWRKVPEGYDNTGHKNGARGRFGTHGSTGLFYMDKILYQFICRNNNAETVNNNYIYTILLNRLKKLGITQSPNPYAVIW